MLKIINQADNSGLGGSLNAFFTSCGVTDGQAYLVIPTPVALGKPTMKVC